MCDPTPHQTAILSACASQPLSTLRSLLSTSPDPAPHAKHMAQTAAENGNASVLSHLILTAPAPSLEPRTSLLLLSAAAHSRPCVEIMLSDQGGCHIDARDDDDDRIGGGGGGNVLDWALGRSGCPDEFVAWLLERGARAERDGGGGGGGGPDDDDDDGNDDDDDDVPENARFCLAGAVARGSVAIMRMLVAHGAEVDASRALHTAVALGYVQKVRFLVEEVGADVNGPGWCRWGSEGIRGPGKPLHRAAEKGYGGLVEYLLAHGARMDARDGVGRTPFQVAFANRRENVMAILKGRGGSTELGIGMIEYTEGYRTRMFV